MSILDNIKAISICNESAFKNRTISGSLWSAVTNDEVIVVTLKDLEDLLAEKGSKSHCDSVETENVCIMQKLLLEILEVYKAKNNDYGESFDNSMQEFGMVAPIIRMSDKLSRIKTLTSSKKVQQVKDESVIDTLKDLANYALLTLHWLQRHPEFFKEKANE